MGRKKIKIEPIQEGRNRQVTYLKRKAGLFKKAYELATLTDSQVAVIVFGHNGRLSQFCSADMDAVLLRYTEHDGPVEHKSSEDFADSAGGDGAGDDDDDDGDEGGPDHYDPRRPPGGPGGPSGSGGSGSGSGTGGHFDRGGSFSGQGGSSGYPGGHSNGFTGGSIGGEYPADGSGTLKRKGHHQSNRTGSKVKLEDRVPSNTASPVDKENLKEAIRRMSRSQGLASTASSKRQSMAVTDRLLNLPGSDGRNLLATSQLPTASPDEMRMDSSIVDGPLGLDPSQWSVTDANLAASSLNASWPLNNASAASTSQIRRSTVIPLSDPFSTLPNRPHTGDGHPNTPQVKNEDTRPHSGGMSFNQKDYFTANRFMSQQQQEQLRQQRQSLASYPVMRQPSFASLDGSRSTPVTRPYPQGTTPFVAGATMNNNALSLGTSVMYGDSFSSPASAPANPYGPYPGNGRPGVSRNCSTPGLSASSISFNRRVTDEFGNPVIPDSAIPSGSSTDGTPQLGASSLATPSESPSTTLLSGSIFAPEPNMPFLTGTGYYETNGLGATGPMKHMNDQMNGTQSHLVSGFAMPAQAPVPLPYLGDTTYFGL